MDYHLDGPTEDDDDDEVMQLDQEDAMDTVLDLGSTTSSAGDIMPRSVSN
jgi:hypothetical protein